MVKDKEELEFVEPEFNEKDFLIHEIEKGKATIVVFLLGLGIGFLSGYLEFVGLGVLSVLLGIAAIFLINPLYNSLNIKTDRRTKTINVFIYLILWLIFWIVSINPPFF
ncbi:MAG: hypothetical protein ACP5NL_02680 [Thermoplasmata archaeon]